MRLQEVRNAKGIEQSALAKSVGVSAPMMSNFEHFKCLPIPLTMQAICKKLCCERSDIYDDKEVYFVEKKTRATLKTVGRLEPEVYKLSVRLPEKARQVLTQENLEKCGYHSLKDFIWHCFVRFEKELEESNEKQNATKHSNCSVADESGKIPTLRTISINHLSIKINHLKGEEL